MPCVNIYETLDIINELLTEYQNNPDNDSQLQAALELFTND